MSAAEALWYVLGAMSGVAACIVLLPLTRQLPRRALWVGTATLAFAGLAFGIYREVGSPEWAAPTRHASAGATPVMSSGGAGSMAEAAGRLAARLARGEGSEADWNLLAQAYEALGDTARAAQARDHQLGETVDPAAASTPPVISAAGVTVVASRLPAMASPPGPQSSAADWADEADRLAAGRRSLQGPAAAAIDEALKRDPRHPKALWLAASLSLEMRDYPRAMERWQQLRAVLPPASPDLAIIEANIAETRQLMGGASASTTIRGTVELDPALRSAARPGMTLFVYARSAGGGGPPLAALRLEPTSWPASFTLDDSAVMLPGSSLGAAGRLFVEARLSAGGSAAARTGDLLGEGAWVDLPAGRASLRLTRLRQ